MAERSNISRRFPCRQLGPVSDFMVNSYCQNLEDTFAQMVYYGVLKEEDAQCFGVTSRIGPNAFVLVTGAILLAFLNGFVCKAFAQYLYDGNPSELRLKANDDSTVRLPDETSQSNDGDEAGDTRADTNIHQVPVLFTDTFRWMLKSSNSGDKSIFEDPNNSHWSLPEATVITDENLTPDRPMMKGTFVRDLSPTGKADIAVTPGSIGLVSSVSFEDSYQSSPRKMDLGYNDDAAEGYAYRLSHRQSRLKNDRRESLGQQSVSSRMDSIGSSSIDGAESFVSSINTNSSIQPPPEAVSNAASPRSLRRGPPPAKYRLSEEMSLKKPPPSYPSQDATYTYQKHQRSAKKPPPESFSQQHVSTRSDYSRGGASFVDDHHDEYSMVEKSVSDIIKEADALSAVQFEDDTTTSSSTCFSQQESAAAGGVSHQHDQRII